MPWVRMTIEIIADRRRRPLTRTANHLPVSLIFDTILDAPPEGAKPRRPHLIPLPVHGL